MVCSLDAQCHGVYDNGCDDGINDIFTCPLESIYGDSLRGSCIYIKDAVDMNVSKINNGNGKGLGTVAHPKFVGNSGKFDHVHGIMCLWDNPELCNRYYTKQLSYLYVVINRN